MDEIELLRQCLRIEKPPVDGCNIDLYLEAEEVLISRYYDFPKIRNALNKRCREV